MNAEAQPLGANETHAALTERCGRSGRPRVRLTYAHARASDIRRPLSQWGDLSQCMSGSDGEGQGPGEDAMAGYRGELRVFDPDGGGYTVLSLERTTFARVLRPGRPEALRAIGDVVTSEYVPTPWRRMARRLLGMFSFRSTALVKATH